MAYFVVKNRLKSVKIVHKRHLSTFLSFEGFFPHLEVSEKEMLKADSQNDFRKLKGFKLEWHATHPIQNNRWTMTKKSISFQLTSHDHRVLLSAICLNGTAIKKELHYSVIKLKLISSRHSSHARSKMSKSDVSISNWIRFFSSAAAVV